VLLEGLWALLIRYKINKEVVRMYSITKVDKVKKEIHFVEDCPICGEVVNGYHNYATIDEKNGVFEYAEGKPGTVITSGQQCLHCWLESQGKDTRKYKERIRRRKQ